MKKIVYVLLSILLLSCRESDQVIPEIPKIPMETMDECFNAYLVENFDLNKDDIISVEEAALVKEIDCSGWNIRSLEGLQYFPALEKLACSNNVLQEIDISQNPALKTLICSDNYHLSKIVSDNPALITLICGRNYSLNELDVSKNPALEYLSCENSYNGRGLTTLMLPPESKIKFLDITDHKMSSFDFSGNQYLKTLKCSGSNMTSLDVSGSVLDTLVCHGQLTSLTIDGCASLRSLSCMGNSLLLVSNNCPALESVYAYGLRNLDVSQSPLLKTLDCAFSTAINQLDFTNNPAMEDLKVGGGNFILFDLSNNFQLMNLEMNNCAFDGQRNIDLSNRKTLKSFTYSWYRMGGTELEAINFNGCTLLEEVVIYHSTAGSMQSLDFSACSALSSLKCSSSSIRELNLEGCVNLAFLECGSNRLSELNLNDCPDLISLMCYSNNLTSLEIGACKKLTDLNCSANQLTSLKTNSDCLSVIHCINNALTDLVIENGISLERLYCYENNLSSLDLTGCLSLQELDCKNNNQLQSLNINDCKALKYLNCFVGSLTQLDVSHCSALVSLDCTANRLQPSLDVSKCLELKELICISNPDLEEIIVDQNNAIENLQKDSHTQIVFSE